MFQRGASCSVAVGWGMKGRKQRLISCDKDKQQVGEAFITGVLLYFRVLL